MSNIVIPKELPDLIDRFHILWYRLRIIKEQRIDSGRHTILETLRNIKAPSELEKCLMEQIEAEEKAIRENDKGLEKIYRDEEAGLYEKVRKVCKGMFLGKYIRHLTAHYTIYMRVEKVTMANREVFVAGHAISFYSDTGNLQWTCEQQYGVFDIGQVIYGNAASTLESLKTEMQHFDIISREDFINQMEEYKVKQVKECDHIIDYALTMETRPLPEDEPVDTSKIH